MAYRDDNDDPARRTEPTDGGYSGTTEHEKELVAVLRTSDSNLLPIVKSLLDSAEIPYVVQGDGAMGLFPLGPFGGGVIRRVLGAAVLVPRQYEAEARELLDTPPATEDRETD